MASADDASSRRRNPRRALRSRFGERAPAGTEPVERLVLRTPTAYRRRLIGVAAVAVILLAAVSGSLAWRQYRADQHSAVNGLNARVALAGLVVDSVLSNGVSTLESVAQAPAVIAPAPAQMAPYFKRVDRTGGRLFTGGISWSDTLGNIQASSSSGTANISDREYFQETLATRRPQVSAGLIGKRSGVPNIVLAIPTFDARGSLTGVLTGGLRLDTLGESRQLAGLGLTGLTIVDRDGRLIMARLVPVRNRPLLQRMETTARGDVANTAGLDGGHDHLVAFATAALPQWKIAIDRPESSVYAAATHSLYLDLASLGVAVLVVLLILALVSSRSGRQIREQGEQAQSWSMLTRALAVAATPAEVADAVLEAVKEVFADAVVIVSVRSEAGEEIRAGSSLAGWRRVQGDSERLGSIAALTYSGPRSWSLDRERSLRAVYLAFGRGLKALHGMPIADHDGAAAGGIGLLTERALLEPSEWELLGAFAGQARHALERARAFEHEHEVAFRLQQSLLPSELPAAPGVEMEGEYLAGGTGVDVGGDWYDAVLRPDGIVVLCVGDVSGRGVGAATVMGRQRSTFRAYAHDCVSPAEILRRMIRHVGDDEMTTVTCLVIDPLELTIVYSSAGHPPALLLDRASGKVTRLEEAGAPPLGVAEPADVVERRLSLPAHGVLAMYTDGLVERRGKSIDEGIDVLAATMAASAELTAKDALAAISKAIGAPADDVALLLTTIEPASTFELELPASPEILPALRRRLRAWLERQGFGDAAPDIVLAVSEALNNAIEHAYRDAEGTVRLVGSMAAGLLQLRVSDQGHWLVSETSDERGRGIVLMNSLMDRVEIETNGEGTTVTLERRGRAPGVPSPVAAPTG